MTANAYYYLFSVGTSIIILYHIANIIYLKKTGRNFIGKAFIEGTTEHKNVQKFLTRRAIFIGIIVLIVSIINTVYAANSLIENSRPGYAKFMLIAAPALSLIIVLVVTYQLSTLFGDNEIGREAKKHNKIEEDW